MGKRQHLKGRTKARDPYARLKEVLFRLALSGAGGLGVVLSFPTYDLAPLAWVTLVPILWAAYGIVGKWRFFLGWWAGTVINLGGFYWIIGTLMDFGHMSVPPAFLLALLLTMYQGLTYAVWLWSIGWLESKSSLPIWLISPVVFVAVEYLHPIIFPWFFSNSQYNLIPMIQLCELGGVTLLSFLLVLTNSLLFDSLRGWRQKRPLSVRLVGFALFVPVVALVYGWIRMGSVDVRIDEAAKLEIGLVEADVGIWEKEDPVKIKDNLVRHQRMSVELEKRGAELIVWPETAYRARQTLVLRKDRSRLEWYRPIPRDVQFIPQSELPPPAHAEEDIRSGIPPEDRYAPQRGYRTPLLFGALTFRKNPKNKSPTHPGLDLLNTAILLDRQGKVLGAYDKVYLLLFGEHIPQAHRFPVVFDWFPEAGDLTPGKSVEVIDLDHYRIGVMICYEDIIPTFTRKVADKRPHILINITNDAWFGKTTEPYLHLALSVFRAVENRVGLVRSTNTGISAFVDPNGRILEKTKITEAESLLRAMPMLQSTTLYQKLGDWPAYLCVLGICIFLLIGWMRRRKRSL